MCGFKLQQHAKRLLLRNFKEGVDFEVARAGEVDNELPGLSEDYAPQAEIITPNFRQKTRYFVFIKLFFQICFLDQNSKAFTFKCL